MDRVKPTPNRADRIGYPRVGCKLSSLLIIRGGQRSTKPDPPDPTVRLKPPPARLRDQLRMDTYIILFFFFFWVSNFMILVGYPPARPFINTIKKKNSTYIIWYTPRSPPHPNHFFSLSTSQCSPDHLSLFSHFRPPPSLSLFLFVTMSLPRRKTKERSLGWEVAGVGRWRWRHGWGQNQHHGLRQAHLIWLFSSTMVAGSGDFLYCGCRIWWDLTGSRKKMGLCLCLGLLCLWLSFGIKFLTILFLFVIEFVWYDLVVL